MNPIVQSILWCVAGVSVGFVIFKLFRRPPIHTENGLVENDAWEPAEIAVFKHLEQIKPLLHGVTKTQISNKELWTDVIVSINNEELTEMWGSAINRPGLWITYLQSFGIQSDFTSEFTCLPEYQDMYINKEGVMINGNKYRVISPCWIYTDSDNIKHIIQKGIVTTLN